ncbi:MAG: IclR family transcriptional regulator [Nocardioidaceae bacterium]|nr:IclR family transcriptional regulator [Nocardioidaceae bacterium]
MEMSPDRNPTPSGSRGSRGSRVQSVDRAALLLRAVAAAEPDRTTAALLAETCGLNRATAWRLLTTLEEHHLVTCDRATGRWSVGPGLLEIAQSSEADTLAQTGHAALEELSLATGETAALAVVGIGGLTYVDEVAPSAIVAATWQGRTVPLHATSTGKAYLATLPDEEVDRLTRDGLRRYTDTTITDADELRAELAATRRRGYGTCRGEYDTAAWGVSAAVLDHLGRPRAVLSIWGPQGRVAESRFPELGTLTAATAEALSARRRLRPADLS